MSSGDNVENDRKDQQAQADTVRRLGFIEIFSGLLVIVGFLQCWIYVVSDRAYLSLIGIALSSPPTIGTRIVVRLNVQNVGHATAFVSDANVTADFTVNPLPDRPVYSPGAKVLPIIGPIVAGATFYGTVRPLDIQGHPFVWKGPPAKFYIYGFVQYDDGFAVFHLWRKRVLGFCGRYEPSDNPSVGDFATCEEAHYRYGN
jgi:hypothetical protein